jgi:hypothetical protein
MRTKAILAAMIMLCGIGHAWYSEWESSAVFGGTWNTGNGSEANDRDWDSGTSVDTVGSGKSATLLENYTLPTSYNNLLWEVLGFPGKLDRQNFTVNCTGCNGSIMLKLGSLNQMGVCPTNYGLAGVCYCENEAAAVYVFTHCGASTQDAGMMEDMLWVSNTTTTTTTTTTTLATCTGSETSDCSLAGAPCTDYYYYAVNPMGNPTGFRQCYPHTNEACTGPFYITLCEPYHIPNVSACTISPAPASTSDNLTCAGTGEVAGDYNSTWTYKWFENGTTAGTGSNLSARSTGSNITCECTLSDDVLNLTKLNSSSLSVGDITAPILSAFNATTTGTVGDIFNLTFNVSDAGTIASCNVEITDGAGNKVNYSGSLVANLTWKAAFIPIAGNYAWNTTYCTDGSGNIAKNQSVGINIVVSNVPSVVIIGGGGGGGGGSSTVLEKINLSLNCAQTEGISLSSGESIICVVSNVGDKATQITTHLTGQSYSIAGQSRNSETFILMMPKEGAINIPIGGNQTIYITENLPSDVDLIKEYTLTLSIIGSNSNTYNIPIKLRWSKTGQIDAWTWLSTPYWKGLIDVGGSKQVVSVPNYIPVVGLLSVIIVVVPNVLKKKRK